MWNRITRFFLRCSGAHLELLEKSPTEHSKYSGLGAAIFFTGLFAALAAAYALYTVFDSIAIALVLGLVWGTMIFNLDRYIISGMRKDASFFRELLMASPRLLLAVIISIVIAKPLELRIFEKELVPELVVMEQEAYAREEEQVRARFSETTLALESQQATLDKAIAIKTQQRDALQKAAQEEADGTGGSRQKNLGPIYRLKKADAAAAENELRDLIRTSEPQYAAIRQKIAHHDSLLQVALKELPDTKRDGLAARMEALDRLVQTSKPVQWASWFIMVLIICIETAPVFIKLIAAKGPYDNLLKMEEHRYTVMEIEETGRLNSNLRVGVNDWPDPERNFVHEQLDRTIKGS